MFLASFTKLVHAVIRNISIDCSISLQYCTFKQNQPSMRYVAWEKLGNQEQVIGIHMYVVKNTTIFLILRLL